ncbi:histamine N-methyltransferase-like [Mustelus asterias]
MLPNVIASFRGATTTADVGGDSPIATPKFSGGLGRDMRVSAISWDSRMHSQCMRFSQSQRPGAVRTMLQTRGKRGEIDIEVLGKIQSVNPGLLIHNEVVEPNPEHISMYKAVVK